MVDPTKSSAEVDLHNTQWAHNSGVNYQQYAVITEIVQWGTPSCSQPQPATNNGVRDGRSNWLVAPPPSWAVPPERNVLSIIRCSSATTGIRSCNLSTINMQCNLLVYAATQGISMRPLRVFYRKITIVITIVFVQIWECKINSNIKFSFRAICILRKLYWNICNVLFQLQIRTLTNRNS